MKTDYSIEIENLILKNFIPATSEEDKAISKTLSEINEMVISVLPAKWIYETDVYDSLKKLGFEPSFGKKEEKQGLYYFVKIKS